MSSSNIADCLIELGTEELPPTALKSLSDAFTQGVISGLENARLDFAAQHVKSFATPRRLAVLVPKLQTQQPDKAIEKLGPAVAAAYDKEGKPSKAAEGFARSNNVNFDELQTVDTDKGERLCFRSVEAGQQTKTLLQDIVSQALSSLPIPRRMRWGASRAEFVRPAHWLLILLNEKTVEANVLGIPSGNLTRGHRFHAPEDIVITSPSSYETILEDKGAVIASFEKRKNLIAEQTRQIASSLGGEAVIEDDLLDEVTALVEKPVALAGRFDETFLSVPNEALIYSMSEHQKYFHVIDKQGKLLPHFITISNIESSDPAKIIAGNERVIRPRLADAAFFFETDKKQSLQSLRERLKSVVFQQQLGTVYEKTARIADLAEFIGLKINADTGAAKLAGEYCKADLASDMVLEFDKMQGVAGAYYARHEGLPVEVADAIQSHYLPKFAGDKVPSTGVACAVALADRLDTLTGIFGIGQEPSGSKDPFALRRASIGTLQIILQNQLTLDLRELIAEAMSKHKAVQDKDTASDKVLHYIFDRFAAVYQEQGLPTEVFLAVRSIDNSDALDFDARIQAVASFVKQPESESLAAANKRVSNILEKSTGDVASSGFNKELLKEDAEKALAHAVMEKEGSCLPLFNKRDYSSGLLKLTELRGPVDAFFDQVMVNAEDEALKNNRLALLARLRELFLKTADISLLVPAKK